MSYTYGDDPKVDGSAAQKRDAVRFLAQDNQPDGTGNLRLTDAEIAFMIDTAPNVYIAAAQAAETIAARMGPVRSKSVGSLSITYDSDWYRKRAGELRMQGSGYQVPYVGGISIADKQEIETDSDVPDAMFRRDKPGVTPSGGTTGSVYGIGEDR